MRNASTIGTKGEKVEFYCDVDDQRLFLFSSKSKKCAQCNQPLGANKLIRLYLNDDLQTNSNDSANRKQTTMTDMFRSFFKNEPVEKYNFVKNQKEALEIALQAQKQINE